MNTKQKANNYAFIDSQNLNLAFVRWGGRLIIVNSDFTSKISLIFHKPLCLSVLFLIIKNSTRSYKNQVLF
jgi:hypothetical protein